MSSSSQDSIQPSPTTVPAVFVSVFVKSQQAFATELVSSLELGRQQLGESPPYARVDDRVIIAKLEENDISRNHVLLTLLPDEKVRVENRSSVSTILVGTDAKVAAGDHRDVTPPALLTLFDRVIQLEPKKKEERPQEILQTLSHRTMPPSQSGDHQSAVDEILSGHRSDENTDYLLRALHATVGVFQLATSSPEFLLSAAQAMIDIVGLDHAAALTCDGSTWKVEAYCQRPGIRADESWEPSQTILRRVREDQRTFWQFLGAEFDQAASLAGVETLIAAPILNAKAEVVGALYGDQRGMSGDEEVTEVEAMLTELLATSIATGLARMEQEQEVVKARVLFDQFFTPELSRQLEAEPDLLLGKDTEVTLLYCEIRGFSHVSEKLGARLTLDWINDVMGTLSNCVAEHEGVLVDTLGDELMGMWGAPVDRADHAVLASRAAIQMSQQLPHLNRRWTDALEKPVELGVGIHTGVARVGNIGSARKFKYGPLGNTVQITRRTQRATQRLRSEILITGETASRLDAEFATRRLGTLQKDTSNDLYELAGDVPSNWEDLKRRFEAALESYERGDLPTAIRMLAKVLADHPGDRPSLQLLAQIHDECG